MSLVFIGRFQPFHKGHLKVLRNYSQDNEVKVVIANAGDRTTDNPLKVEERKEILDNCIQNEVFSQKDIPDDDEKWTLQILGKTGAEGVITGNSWTKEAFIKNTEVEIYEPEMHRPDLYSGSEVRVRIRSGDEWRYLVPDCCLDVMEEEDLIKVIEGTGIEYEFEPGWKPENASN